MLVPEILAVYLPQFYENEDNNRWWGRGFTDWETVKTAEQYFVEHDEPKVPLGGKYYDLSRKETMQEQAKLAREYGIDGFCFYHYYFKDGKKELELPAENLLKWKDVDMRFCFNWASEPWIRSWSRISGNVWAEKFEDAGLETQKSVLAEQDYGNYDDWVRHFEYLLPFFRDDRYVKREGKPLFIFYSPDDIKPIEEMSVCWRELARRAGLPGLFLVGARMNGPKSCLDAALIYEPRNSINALNHADKLEIRNGIRCFDYQMAWEKVLESQPFFEYKTYFCGISGYDDTPRRGQSGETLMQNTPEIFRQYLTKLLRKSIEYGNEYLFINAWNEWGEGMYLEPDERNGYKYLEAVRDAVRQASAEDVPATVEKTENTDYTEAIKKELFVLNYNAVKFKHLFQILDKWLFLEQEGKISFSDFLRAEQVNSVAIYGMSSLGKHLYIQLQKEKKPALFGIDRYVGQFGSDYKIYRPEECFPHVDAIIVTAYDTMLIKKQLKHSYKGKIFGLEDILDKMMKD